MSGKRVLIMRCTMASCTLLACAVLLGSLATATVIEESAHLSVGKGAVRIDRELADAGFRLDRVRRGDAVPRYFVASFPRDMAKIDQPGERKRIFLKLMLPLVLEANERVLAERGRLLSLVAKLDAGQPLSPPDRAWLDNLAATYKVENGDLEELGRRVDSLPVSLFLAQSAIESGWGTSRFTHEGNAVFGQRAWSEGAGIVPTERAEGATHVVRSFDMLPNAVFAYLVNINRHPAYERLRELRAGLRAQGRPFDSDILAAGLRRYAEKPDYVSQVRDVIRQNRLKDFDNARLAEVST